MSEIALDEPLSVALEQTPPVEKPAQEVPPPRSTPKPRAAKVVTPPWQYSGGTKVFEGFGAWVDLFDFDLDPVSTIANMKSNGVRTLYIQTGRSNTQSQVDSRVGPWLEEAHRQQIAVVGWYLPFYVKIPFDIERSLAVKKYSYKGHRFDGVGIDIEYRAAVRGPITFSKRVSRHLKAVRELLGPDYPLASIPPTPLQMRVAPDYWAGFPWAALGEHSDAVLLMSYWSDRVGCPHVSYHCAYGFTYYNVLMTRQAIANPNVKIHVIGGVGHSISRSDVADFIRGAQDSQADGASIYDARTTAPQWWRMLSVLRELKR